MARDPEEVAELVSPGGGTGPFPEGGTQKGRTGVSGDAGEDGGEQPDGGETVSEPGKVIRIGSMLKQLLDEVRQAPLDDASRDRLREIYEISISELSGGLSESLSAELARISLPFGEGTPSEAELRVAQAQLVGWLEGLFHGIQATLFAQQMAARSQLEQMQHRGLPRGGSDGLEPTGPGSGPYL